MSHLKPKIQDLLIRQGSGEHFVFQTNDYQGVPFDPTGFRMQMRPTVDSDTVSLSLTDSDAEVVLPTDDSGQIHVVLDHIATSSIEAGSYVYDVEIEKDLIWYRICQGDVVVDPEVTR